VEIDAYLERVGFAGEARADLATLGALQGGHVVHIPFENLSPLMGEEVPLGVEALVDKLVHRKRGGWCFEHNGLFAHVLREIGFEVTTLAARVRWNIPAHVTTARSHMVLLVDVRGERFLADVGFGGLTLTSPLRFEPGLEQITPHEPHRIVEDGEGFALEAFIGGEWGRLYNFDLVPAMQADYEVSNWYLGHHPESPFVKGLLCARADHDRRHALRNTRYAIHHRHGETERRVITDLAELKSVLAYDLKIPLPEAAKLDPVLEHVIAANSA
jgi:N-hydroxyarylamine O-acetyltransferase